MESTVIEIESAWAKDVDSYIDKGLNGYENLKEDNFVVLQVTDNGPGISSE